MSWPSRSTKRRVIFIGAGAAHFSSFFILQNTQYQKHLCDGLTNTWVRARIDNAGELQCIQSQFFRSGKRFLPFWVNADLHDFTSQLILSAPVLRETCVDIDVLAESVVLLLVVDGN